MEELEQPIPESEIVNTVEQAVALPNELAIQLSFVRIYFRWNRRRHV